MKIIKKLGLGFATLASVGTIAAVVSCNEITDDSGQIANQSKLDNITQDQVLQALRLKENSDQQATAPTQPEDKVVTINGLEQVSVKIENWNIDEVTKTVSFQAILSKEGLNSKTLRINYTFEENPIVQM
ncbi:MAG: hypothetical protein NC236_00070 [Mycoplasma sp.]|nr:hypothetical protein [Mycoplasma sp.]